MYLINVMYLINIQCSIISGFVGVTISNITLYAYISILYVYPSKDDEMQ